MATISAYAQQVGLLNQLNMNTNAAVKNAKRVATGQKVNSAADDASLYAIAKQMEAEVKSLNQASSNTQTGSSMLKVADGAMSNTVDILTSLKEKAIAAANSTYKDSDRAAMQAEFNQYLDQVNDNAMVNYNGINLMNGSYTSATQETTQAYTNTSLAKDTTGATKLTDLADRNSSSLNIASTDNITVSYVKDGKTFNTTYSAGDTTLEDIFNNINTASGDTAFDTSSMATATAEIGTDSSGKKVYTVDGSNGVTVKAGEAGTAGMIAGFSISVTDSAGNKKNTATNALSGFSESIAAANKSDDNALNVQIGTESGQSMNMSIGGISARALGLQGSDGKYISVGTREDAEAAISALDNAINKVLDQQTTIGAYTSRLEYTDKNLTTQSENVTNAKSTLIDADLAKEITQYATNNMLVQATQTMLAQSYKNSTWFLNLLG